MSRSLEHISAQAIDDDHGHTIVSVSSTEPAVRALLQNGARGGNVAGARVVGKLIAKRLIERGMKRVVFDRGGFLYHGRVRSVAEAAREAGLEF